MPSINSDLTIPRVIAVCEDAGQPPKIIPQDFKLHIRCSPRRFILFRLVVSFTGDASVKTMIYLQITGDYLGPLDLTVHNKTDSNAETPPNIEDICKLLKDITSVTRLQFQLRSSERIQLVVPSDFNPDKIPNNKARVIFKSAESLAAASSFSLYFQHNVLKKEMFQWYQEVISLPLTDDLRRLYGNTRDLRGLYKGRGGKVHIPRQQQHPHHGYPPSTEPCSSPAPAMTASYGSTLPFDAFPRLQQEYQEDPPPYDECPSEGRSTNIRQDAISPGADLAPPGYGNTERRHNALDPSSDALPSGKQDTDMRPTSKRKRSSAAVCSPRTARDASRAVKIPPSPLNLNDENVARFLHLVEQQRQQIERQSEQIEQLQKNFGEMQRRYDELEANYIKLENRQEQADDTIDNLSIDVGELEDKYVEVIHQIPDVCDEFEDLKESIGDTFKEDIYKSIEASIERRIEERVDDQVEGMKRRICQALQ
ncbi:hypothetical protein CSUB01_12301 [Colletotrichum sublineola]|uniref:Uncharacterized protein n=1 Tax=Colletotrichum sublineola TaxID=1173701 RepID=A0A066WVK2_COLSU|nr:hypothetical protein CSUB01_12301 [Colletotrichum sublineola]